MNTLACYLLRDDGKWYALGPFPYWRSSFGVFPGPADGSLQIVTPEDSRLLALRLDEPGTFPLAHGFAPRMEYLATVRAYGNAIVEPLAREVIGATIDLLTEDT